jgi:hypothetical protein
MKFSAFTLSILGAAACVSAQNNPNTNATTRTAELLEGLQRAPTRLARLNVLKENTDVGTFHRLLWPPEPDLFAVVIRLHLWHGDHEERGR